MSTKTDRFIEAVRLALQKRDIEKGRVTPPAHPPQPKTPPAVNSPTAPRHTYGRNTDLHAQSPSNSVVLASPLRSNRTTDRRGVCNDAVSEGSVVVGTVAENARVARSKRPLVSMFDEEDEITPQEPVREPRPVSRASNRNVDLVVVDDDSDDDCIDLTNMHAEGVIEGKRVVDRLGDSNVGSSSTEDAGSSLKMNTKKSRERGGVVGGTALESSYHEGMESKEKLDRGLDQPPAKRKKKEKEKRAAKYRSAPSKAALDRLERSRGHRLFLVEKSNRDGKIQCAVMGSNGNIYNCVIDLEPRCNCPDFTKRKDGSQQGPCKHLIFIFVRVLKLDCEDPRWWQRCLVQSELDGLIDIARGTHSTEPGVLAEEAVRTEYQKTLSDKKEGGRRPLEGECTVCYEDLVQADGNTRPENVTTFCKTCGNNFHSACLDNWFRAQSNRTCPLCRANIGGEEGKAGGADIEYLNLAQHSSAHEQELTLEQRYADTYMFIGNRRGRGRGTASRRRA